MAVAQTTKNNEMNKAWPDICVEGYIYKHQHDLINDTHWEKLHMNKLIIKEFIRAASGYCLQNQLKFYIVILIIISIQL